MAFFAIPTISTRARAQGNPRAEKAYSKTQTAVRRPEPQIDNSLTSFNELVLAHQQAAFNFAAYLLNDPDLAEDVTQKAFINAYLNFHNFHGTSFRSWLFKIIKNASYDEFRRPSYRKNTSLDAMEDAHDRWTFADETQDPEQAVENKERSALIQRALTRVDENYRAVLILVDLQDFDYQEAAHAAGVPVGTIKSRLARARQQFRAAMDAISPAL